MTSQPTSVEDKPLAQARHIPFMLGACAVVSVLSCVYLWVNPVFVPAESPLLRWFLVVAPTTLPLCLGLIAWVRLVSLHLPFETERQQATIRNVIAHLILVYVTGQNIYDGEIAERLPDVIAMAYYGLSWLFLGHILVLPQPNFPRRVAGMVAENGLLTLAFIGGGAISAPLWPMYLWTALGNGFRYGVQSLFISTSLALAGFTAATLLNPFWRVSPWQTVGQFLALIIIPTYVTSLLRQLHAAKSQAEAANSAKSRFIAVMSHELRTPLSAMLGSVSMLKGVRLDDDENRLMHVITNSGQSLLSMINELLDFSAIETGKTHFEIRDVPIFDLLATTLRTLVMAAEEKGLRLAMHADCRLPPVLRTDGEHVRRIITNLVWNAIKFTRTGRIDVSMRLSADSANLIIDIQDTGVGIAEDKQAKIFDPFVQGDDRVERAYEGVGLGLAIVRELAMLHKGRISVKSKLNVGSRFTVELPITAAETLAEPVGASGADHVAIIAGSGPLAGGGLLDACRPVGIACSFADPEPGSLRKALIRANSPSPPIVFLSHRDTASGNRVVPEYFDMLVEAIENEQAIPVLVLDDADDEEVADRYRMMVPASVTAPDAFQLANLVRFIELLDPKAEELESGDYVPQKSCRILLVEDNATNRFITNKALSNAGHQLTAAESGEAALNALDDGQFDIVIMDINMPGLNGIETTKVIRTINYSDTLRIIGLTADVTHETKRQCLEAGMDLVLTKPAAISVMLKAIDDLAIHGTAVVPSEKVTPIEAGRNFRARRAPIIDDTGFQRLRDIGDPSFMLESLTLFLAESTDLIAELEQALDQHDRGAAFDVFHSLKGICANVGALRLREIVTSLRSADDLITERKAHIKRLRDELEAFQIEATQRVPDLRVVPLPYSS